MDIELEARCRWDDDNFLLKGQLVVPAQKVGDGIPYESYMVAWPIGVLIPEQSAELLIEFSAGAPEASELHRHDYSDRIIKIIEGGGTFMAIRNGERVELPLEPGDVLYMPRGVVHTFIAGPAGLTVISTHNPFIPFGDQRCYQSAGVAL